MKHKENLFPVGETLQNANYAGSGAINQPEGHMEIIQLVQMVINSEALKERHLNSPG
jgi:hypothetical protein